MRRRFFQCFAFFFNSFFVSWFVRRFAHSRSPVRSFFGDLVVCLFGHLPIRPFGRLLFGCLSVWLFVLLIIVLSGHLFVRPLGRSLFRSFICGSVWSFVRTVVFLFGHFCLHLIRSLPLFLLYFHLRFFSPPLLHYRLIWTPVLHHCIFYSPMILLSFLFSATRIPSFSAIHELHDYMIHPCFFSSIYFGLSFLHHASSLSFDFIGIHTLNQFNS